MSLSFNPLEPSRLRFPFGDVEASLPVESERVSLCVADELRVESFPVCHRTFILKIFYGICGEGMGHAGRSIALIERLKGLGHRVTIFTFADAFRLLASAGYQPHRIEGLQFRLRGNGGVDPLKSVCNLLQYLRRRRESLDFIRQLALAEQTDVFITDFEPLCALAATSLGLPCYSIDNQHRFCHPLGSDFPLYLQVYSHLTGEFVRRWIKEPRKCLVAVFHQCPRSRHYLRVDALLRDRIAGLRPSDEGHVLLYGRGELGRQMARVASTVPERFIAYGCENVAARKHPVQTHQPGRVRGRFGVMQGGSLHGRATTDRRSALLRQTAVDRSDSESTRAGDQRPLRAARRHRRFLSHRETVA